MKDKLSNPPKGLRFSPVPNWLMKRKEVSPGAKLAYGRLGQYAGGATLAFPGFANLARELGTSKRSAKRYIRELESHRLIRRERRWSGRTDYHFLAHEWMDPAKCPCEYAGYLQPDHWENLCEKKLKEARHHCRHDEGGPPYVHHQCEEIRRRLAQHRENIATGRIKVFE